MQQISFERFRGCSDTRLTTGKCLQYCLHSCNHYWTEGQLDMSVYTGTLISAIKGNTVVLLLLLKKKKKRCIVVSAVSVEGRAVKLYPVCVCVCVSFRGVTLHWSHDSI